MFDRGGHAADVKEALRPICASIPFPDDIAELFLRMVHGSFGMCVMLMGSLAALRESRLDDALSHMGTAEKALHEFVKAVESGKRDIARTMEALRKVKEPN